MTTALDRLAAALADRYRHRARAGPGGMATVYLAHDLRHDRKVAIKVLRPELAAVIGAERFLREIQHHRRPPAPAHPRRSSTRARRDGHCSTTSCPSSRARSLRDRLSREKQLPIADAVRIATRGRRARSTTPTATA